jgi:hypothetical protein
MCQFGVTPNLGDNLLDDRSGIGFNEVNQSARKHIYHLSNFIVDPLRFDSKGKPVHLVHSGCRDRNLLVKTCTFQPPDSKLIV